MLDFIKTPLTTLYANATTEGLWEALCVLTEPLYLQFGEMWSAHDIQMTCVRECAVEDRFIMEVTGALPSEVWA